jgi:hypothetical protein
LKQNKHIINIDESIVSETDHRNKSWSVANKPAFTDNSQRLGRVSIIAGVSSRGNLYYTINLGNNNSEKVWLFILKLCKHLQSKDSNWRKNTIIMLDNAPYHRSNMLIDNLEDLRIPIMFLGPY